MTNGIDVSENNGRVDWEKVAAAGMKFAIIRSSYGRSSADGEFVRNVIGAHNAGLQCGAYHYSYALTPEQARQEARSCKKIIEDAGVLLELPVWFDMEDADGYKRRHGFDFSASNVTEICRAFLQEIKPLDCGVYASLNWLENYIYWRDLGCAVWNVGF